MDIETFKKCVDYLLNLEEDDLIEIAADFLGWEPGDINYDFALRWVDGLSEFEVKTIWSQMEDAA